MKAKNYFGKFSTSTLSNIPLWKLTYPPKKWWLEDETSFKNGPLVGGHGISTQFFKSFHPLKKGVFFLPLQQQISTARRVSERWGTLGSFGGKYQDMSLLQIRSIYLPNPMNFSYQYFFPLFPRWVFKWDTPKFPRHPIVITKTTFHSLQDIPKLKAFKNATVFLRVAEF